MKNQRPYLLRGFYDWIVDSNTTPYLLINVTSDAVQVPAEFVSNGQIILNISPSAVRNLLIDDEAVAFDGRFSGQSFPVHVPLWAVAAIYAKENGQGMMFEAVVDDEAAAPEVEAAASAADQKTQQTGAEQPASAPEPTPAKGAHLKVIK